MSYHILHQFDEQWLADLTQGGEGDKGRSFLSISEDGRRSGRKGRLSSRESRRWAVVAASILLAAFALLFALDANRRAEALQQRLDSIEATVRAK